MTPLHPTRRSAERFADLVDRSGAGSGGDVDVATADLLALVGALRGVPEAQPRAEFATDLRARLMTAAETELVAAPVGQRTGGREISGTDDRLTVRRGTRRPHERRLAVALGAFAIVGSTASMAVASQSALPGDALYPLKRVIETTHAHLSPSDQGKGNTYLDSAGDRLSEVQALTHDGGGDPDQVTPTLQAFTAELNRGAGLLMQDYRDHGTTSSIDTLRRFDSASMLKLTALDGTVPAASQPALIDAAKQLFTVDAEAAQLCPGCSDAGIREIPATLLASDTGASTPDAAASAVPSASDLTGHRGPRDTPTSGPTPGSSAGPTTGPTAGPTSVPTNGPTGRPTNGPTSGASASPKVSPTNIVSALVSAITKSAQPSQNPSPILPTDLPSVLPSVLGPVVSGLATAVASTIGGLVGGVGGG